jgi:hypothetical protein
MKMDWDEKSEDRHGMKFTMRATHYMFIIFLGAIVVGYAPYFGIGIFQQSKDEAPVLGFVLAASMLLGMLFFGSWTLLGGIRYLYDHIDVDGEKMTVYVLGHKPLTLNCHGFDYIVYNPSFSDGKTVSEALLFFYKKEYKNFLLYRKGGCTNFDEMLLYLKQNKVKLRRD